MEKNLIQRARARRDRERHRHLRVGDEFEVPERIGPEVAGQPIARECLRAIFRDQQRYP